VTAKTYFYYTSNEVKKEVTIWQKVYIPKLIDWYLQGAWGAFVPKTSWNKRHKLLRVSLSSLQTKHFWVNLSESKDRRDITWAKLKWSCAIVRHPSGNVSPVSPFRSTPNLAQMFPMRSRPSVVTV